ncbi:hypothetical protein UFOVP146_47 [uncultured Caudovirales phage]|uniref:Uncharacterized protein n=1 Tax=uncultured Caudovirales phage TaxID=2100421 RepID=A0A6J7VL13_9CAUD|nr:hypothetical protein UFOVP146_47 [uncultured Caudovirales phage]
MSNKKLREGQPIGMGVRAPMGAEKKALRGKVSTAKQPQKAKQPKGGY